MLIGVDGSVLLDNAPSHALLLPTSTNVPFGRAHFVTPTATPRGER